MVTPWTSVGDANILHEYQVHVKCKFKVVWLSSQLTIYPFKSSLQYELLR